MAKHRQLIAADINGETRYAEGVYIVNAAELSSVGGEVAASGYSVGTTHAELSAGLTNRKTMAIQNNGSEILYLGQSGISTDAMYPVATGGQISLNVTSGVQIFGATSSSTTDVRILELS